MLERNICAICRRGCREDDQKRCLNAPRLNLGSGEMLLKDYINFDMTEFVRGGLRTDIIGKIEDILSIFGENVFAEILCSHVIEHFRPNNGAIIVKDCHTALRPGGKLIMEGPDVLGIFEVYKDNHKNIITHLFGCQQHVDHWGNEWAHKWGWTKDTMAETMALAGFKITHKGIGLTHGMGRRDFRVEGIK